MVGNEAVSKFKIIQNGQACLISSLKYLLELNESYFWGRLLQGLVKLGQNMCRDKRYVCTFKAVETGPCMYLHNFLINYDVTNRKQ